MHGLHLLGSLPSPQRSGGLSLTHFRSLSRQARPWLLPSSLAAPLWFYQLKHCHLQVVSLDSPLPWQLFCTLGPPRGLSVCSQSGVQEGD